MINLDVQKQFQFEDFNMVIFSSFTEQLKNIWTVFEDNYSWNPFYTYPWISFWQNTIGEPLYKILPQIVVVKQGESVLGIFPFAITRRNGIKVLEWIGGIHADYTGPLLTPNFEKVFPNFCIFWDKLLISMPACDVIHLRRQPKTIGNIENPFVSSFKVSISENAYQASLNGTWLEYYNSRIKKKIRADSRRQRNRLEELGEVKFIVANSTMDEGDIIKNMIIQKRQRYRDTGINDMLAIKEHRDFYLGLSEQKFIHFQLHCASLMVDNKIIATHVGLVNENYFYYLMPANLGGDWNRYSPGRLLLENLLEWAYKEKLLLFDFTIGAESYKKEWCDLEIKLFEYLKPLNYKGKYYDSLQSLKKKLFQNKELRNLIKKTRIINTKFYSKYLKIKIWT